VGGAVEEAGERMVTLVLDEPARGLGLIGVGGPGGEVYIVVRAQLFGCDAAGLAAREQEAWKAWFARRAAPAHL
jgi:hypothetical protein